MIICLSASDVYLFTHLLTYAAMSLPTVPSDEPTQSPKRDLDTMESDTSTLLTTEGSSLNPCTDASSPEVRRVRKKLAPKAKGSNTSVIKAVKKLTLDSPNDNSTLDSESSQAGSPTSNYAYLNSPKTASQEDLGDLGNNHSEASLDKRQKRLQRNRLAAQESRQKKKVYLTELETQVKFFEEENHTLLLQIKKLSEQLGSGSVLEFLDMSAEEPNQEQKFQPISSPTSRTSAPIFNSLQSSPVHYPEIQPKPLPTQK